MPKIAFVTNNGTTISSHFGRARQYVIVTLNEGQVIDRMIVEKPFHQDHGHDHDAGQHHGHDHNAGQHHGHDHAAMLAPIADCVAVLTRGVGAGMEQHLRAAGIRPIRTTITAIDAGISAFLAGGFDNPLELSPR